MQDPIVHYCSYSRGSRPLCGAPYVPETVRVTFAFRHVTCPKCLDSMSEETVTSEVGQSAAGSALG
jgi:hypothetical protein